MKLDKTLEIVWDHNKIDSVSEEVLECKFNYFFWLFIFYYVSNIMEIFILFISKIGISLLCHIWLTWMFNSRFCLGFYFRYYWIIFYLHIILIYYIIFIVLSLENALGNSLICFALNFNRFVGKTFQTQDKPINFYILLLFLFIEQIKHALRPLVVMNKSLFWLFFNIH